MTSRLAGEHSPDPFTQQGWIKPVLCGRPCPRHWDTMGRGPSFCPYRVFLLEMGGAGPLPREDGWPR